MSLKSERSEIHRLGARGHYDRETVFAILDRNFLCHVAYLHDDTPHLIPTAYGREGDVLFFHGSVKSQMLHSLASGAEAAVAVTEINAIVLARSLFHSSMNYHSVVVYGYGEEVIDTEQKMHALQVVSDAIWPGRWDEARIPDAGELKATMVIRFQITDGAAKIRTGPAKDNAEDYALDHWAGIIPVRTEFGMPEPDAQLREMEIPDNILRRIH